MATITTGTTAATATARVAALTTTTTGTGTTKATAIGAAEQVGAPAALALQCWLSPAFPVGGYAYSHGLEWAAEAGDVRDERTLLGWLSTTLLEGVGRSDAILLGAAHRAAMAGDDALLSDINDLALALSPSAELRLETAQQGRSFLEAVSASWPHPQLAARAAELDPLAYPVAVGTAAACHGIPAEAAAQGYLTALAGNFVSAAIRLAPIGQTAGQRVLARLVPELARLAAEAVRLDCDDIGSPTFRADLGSFRHETQYTRLFRS